MPCKKYIPAWHLSIILLFHGHLHGEDFGFAVLECNGGGDGCSPCLFALDLAGFIHRGNAGVGGLVRNAFHIPHIQILTEGKGFRLALC